MLNCYPGLQLTSISLSINPSVIFKINNSLCNPVIPNQGVLVLQEGLLLLPGCVESFEELNKFEKIEIVKINPRMSQLLHLCVATESMLKPVSKQAQKSQLLDKSNG